MVCAYVEEDSIIVKFGPAYLFVGASLAVTLLLPQGYVHMFVFYSLREVFIAWMLFSQHINTSPPTTIGYGCD